MLERIRCSRKILAAYLEGSFADGGSAFLLKNLPELSDSECIPNRLAALKDWSRFSLIIPRSFANFHYEDFAT